MWPLDPDSAGASVLPGPALSPSKGHGEMTPKYCHGSSVSRKHLPSFLDALMALSYTLLGISIASKQDILRKVFILNTHCI